MLAQSLLAFLAAFSCVNAAAIEKRALPTPVSAATARSYLTQLTVAAQSNIPAYDRELFPHWSTQSGACNTREVVLKRDGTNVVQDSACAATSGSWYCQYTGITYSLSSDLDIDHMVPLSNAWRSGARNWSTAQRQAFANDLTRPQLIAVEDNANQIKSDQGPENWLPARTSYHCTYVRAWVQVKYFYDLTVTQAEYNAIDGVLVDC